MDLVLLLLLAAAAALVLAVVWLWTPDKQRAVLERDYLNDPADMIEVGGAALHVRDAGPRTEPDSFASDTAPTVILLHGFGASLHTWEPWARALSQHHRVISLDLPGSGLSPPDPAQDYGDARAIALLLALMDRKGVAQAVLIGNSIGGRIAWRAAAAHPERVRKLVLIAPDGFASPGFEYDKAPKVPAMMTLMRYYP